MQNKFINYMKQIGIPSTSSLSVACHVAIPTRVAARKHLALCCSPALFLHCSQPQVSIMASEPGQGSVVHEWRARQTVLIDNDPWSGGPVTMESTAA